MIHGITAVTSQRATQRLSQPLGATPHLPLQRKSATLPLQRKSATLPLQRKSATLPLQRKSATLPLVMRMTQPVLGSWRARFRRYSVHQRPAKQRGLQATETRSNGHVGLSPQSVHMLLYTLVPVVWGRMSSVRVVRCSWRHVAHDAASLPLPPGQRRVWLAAAAS